MTTNQTSEAGEMPDHNGPMGPHSGTFAPPHFSRLAGPEDTRLAIALVDSNLHPGDRLLGLSAIVERDRLRAELATAQATESHLRAQLAEAEKGEAESQAAFSNLLERYEEEQKKARDAGLSFQTIRDILNKYETEEASFSKVVEVVRIAAATMAKAERDAAQARVGEMEVLLREARIYIARHTAPTVTETAHGSITDRIDAALATSPHRLAGRGDR